MSRHQIVHDLEVRNFKESPFSGSEIKDGTILLLDAEVKRQALAQQAADFRTMEDAASSLAPSTIQEFRDRKAAIELIPSADRTKSHRKELMNIVTHLGAAEKRKGTLNACGGKDYAILRERVDSDLQAELDESIKNSSLDLMRGFDELLADWRTRFKGPLHIILKHIRQMIAEVGYATNLVELARMINQLRHIYDLTFTWLRDSKGAPCDPESPPVSETEWTRELVQRCTHTPLIEYKKLAQRALDKKKGFLLTCQKLIKKQAEEVQTMDQAPQEHPHRHPSHPAHPAHVAFEEFDLVDAQQRALQDVLDAAAFWAEAPPPAVEVPPAFFASPPRGPRPPFSQGWRGQSSYPVYPRGPGRGPYWSPPNPYRQGQQNQRPGLNTHANQHVEFSAQGKDGDPPLAKVMCAHWDGTRCHSGDPNCGLGHPPGVCAPAGGGKSDK